MESLLKYSLYLVICHAIYLSLKNERVSPATVMKMRFDFVLAISPSQASIHQRISREKCLKNSRFVILSCHIASPSNGAFAVKK